MKEWAKATQKAQNKMEMSNRLGKEFKTLVIKILKVFKKRDELRTATKRQIIEKITNQK